jgi:uncharacterized delta-60 repeat protein
MQVEAGGFMTRRHVVIGFLTLALVVSASDPISVLAADGDLDPTFGVGGRVTYSNASANASAIQSDGKIIVAGSIGGSPDSDFVLVRYNRDGSLDTAFGIAGKVTTDFSGQRDWANAIGIQPDGKMLLNWQQGTSARHTVTSGTEAGTWIVTGIRAHENENDHGGEFVPVFASVTVVVLVNVSKS